MRPLRARAILLAAVIAALAASAAARAVDESTRAAAAPPRVPAQARTMVKYIASGSIDVASAVAGTRDLAGGLATDAAGNLYVALTNASRAVEVAIFSPEGRLLRRWDPTGGLSVGNATLLAIGPDGLVYVRNRNERIIRVFTPTGTPVRSFGGSLSANNHGDLEVDTAGNVYTIDLDKIVKFNAAGQVAAEFRPFPGIQADRLNGLAVGPNSSLYVTVFPLTTGLPQQPPVLVHLDASGNRLPVFDPSFHLPGSYRDVEFANSRLYFSGPLRGPAKTDHTKVAAAVFSPQGELIDFAVGTGQNEPLAVHGEDVYVRSLATGRAIAQSNGPIGHLEGVPVFAPGVGGDLYGCGATGNTLARRGAPGGPIPDIALRRPSGCLLSVANIGSPCPKTSISTPTEVHLGGQEITGATDLNYEARSDLTYFQIPANAISSGYLLVKWTCVDKSTNQVEERYEWKGRIDVIDPSGNVFDAETNRRVAGAIVRLQFSLKKEGPFAIPDISGFVPQVNPQTTGRDGFFGWDVAEGFWRMQITAFGYKPFTSPVYKIPPEVKGLRLKLRPDPRQQALVIDPQGGRAGTVRLGAKVKRVRATGLKLRVARGRVRSITVRSKSYRTVQGVRLGTPTVELLAAYPPRARAANTRLITARKQVGHRVGKATFTVRSGRVVGIKLGR